MSEETPVPAENENNDDKKIETIESPKRKFPVVPVAVTAGVIFTGVVVAILTRSKPSTEDVVDVVEDVVEETVA